MAANEKNTLIFNGPVGNVNTGDVYQTINMPGLQSTMSTPVVRNVNGTKAEQSESEAFRNVKQFLQEHFHELEKCQDMLNANTNHMSEDKGSREAFLDELRKCSLIFVTANSCEEKTATQFFYRQNGKKLWFRAVDDYSIQLGNFCGIPAAHIHPTRYGAIASERLSNWLSENNVHPKLLISAGVAYGMYPNNQQLGDVLFSGMIIDMDAPHKETDGEIILSFESIYKVDNHCPAAWKSYCENVSTWHWGTMLSKNCVLSDSALKDEFLQAARGIGCKDVIGGEMEYAGFFRAAEADGTPSRIIGIKGICDWGEEKNCYGKAAEELDSVTIKENDRLKNLVQCYAAEKALEALAQLIKERGSVLD